MDEPVVHLCSMRQAEGSATVNGRKWRWEFHSYLGPTFLRADGEPMVHQPGPNHPVWDHFEAWLKNYQSQEDR